MFFELLADVDRVIKRISFPWCWFHVGMMGEGFYIQVRYNERDIKTKEMTEQHGRKWYISPFSTESEVFQTGLKAVLTSAEHRVREHFLVDGVRVFGPHLDVDALIDFVKAVEEDKR